MFSLIHYLYKQYTTVPEVLEVIWFNYRVETLCNEHDRGMKCTNENCLKFKLDKMISYLRNAKKTIDLCIFTIDEPRLVQAIIDANDRGVRVRVITDHTASYITLSIAKFKKNGIRVLTKKSVHHMHHKFCCIDVAEPTGVVMFGSLNWTWSAVQKNWETVNIMSDQNVRESFQKEFNDLWKEFMLTEEQTKQGMKIPYVYSMMQ